MCTQFIQAEIECLHYLIDGTESVVTETNLNYPLHDICQDRNYRFIAQLKFLRGEISSSELRAIDPF
jgi:hypothetical protein